MGRDVLSDIQANLESAEMQKALKELGESPVR